MTEDDAAAPAFTPDDVQEVFDLFDAPVVAFDCGERCAVENEGVPVCCDDDHAIPVLYDAEYRLIRERSELWRPFRARDAADRRLRDTLHPGTRFARCLGHERCERDNRSFSCRSFPFFPYIDPENEFVGMSYYWDFQDRCHILNATELVQPAFRGGFFAAWDAVFERLPSEVDAYFGLSATCRRIHTRGGRSFYVIDREGEVLVRRPGETFLLPRELCKKRELPEATRPRRIPV